jgi:hypothetical protein
MMTEDEPGLPLGDAVAKPEPQADASEPYLPLETETGSKIDWNNSEDVIVREQRSIAVYRNRYGGVVILEEAGALDDEDMWMVLSSQEALRRLIAALQEHLE